MKKQKGIITLIITWLVLCILLAFIINLQIFELKILLIIADILLFWFLLLFLLLRRKNKFLVFLGYILSLLTIISSFGSIYYIKQTTDFLDKSYDDLYKYKNTYYVITLNNDKYIKLKNLNEKNIGYYKNVPYIEKALEKLDIKIDYNKKEYSKISEMMLSLKNEEIDAIVLDKSFYDFVMNLSSYNKKDYKIIYKYNLSFNKKVEKHKTNDKYFNIYVVGTDEDNLYSYFNMLITVNREKHKILITTIPKAYYVDINKKKDTIGYSSIYGIDVSKKAIENLYDINIDYYLKINTEGFTKLIEELNGIKFCSDKSYILNNVSTNMYKLPKEKIKIKKGCHNYNGDEILSLIKNNSDFSNQQNQKNIENITNEIIKKFLVPDINNNFNIVLNSLDKLTETNIKKDTVSKITKETLKSKWKIENEMAIGESSFDEVHMSGINGYVIVPDEKNVKKISKRIKEVLK